MRPVKIATAEGSTFVTTFELFDTDGDPVNLSDLGATRVVVSVCGPGVNAEISSDTDDVTFLDNRVQVRFGQMGLKPQGLPYFPKISYVIPDGDNEVITGKGFPSTIELTVRC